MYANYGKRYTPSRLPCSIAVWGSLADRTEVVFALLTVFCLSYVTSVSILYWNNCVCRFTAGLRFNVMSELLIIPNDENAHAQALAGVDHVG